MNSFGNVESAVLRFDQCYSAEAEDWHPFYPQTAGFRFQAIDDFFSMLASLKLPVKELGLWNLQVDNPRNQETLKKLRGVLSGLRSLRLTVVCEHSGAAPEDDIEVRLQSSRCVVTPILIQVSSVQSRIDSSGSSLRRGSFQLPAPCGISA